jgi:hypothetical protein
MSSDPRAEYTFAVCLSHDVDRIYKTYQYVYNALERRYPPELLGVLSPKNPFWTFERIMDVESRLGVRSSFNVLDEFHITERPPWEWLTSTGWKLFAGRYDVEDPDVAATLRVLDELGWEVALHGSYTSSTAPGRFVQEKERIESVVGTEVVGNRQHYWRGSPPETWHHLANAGIRYDTSLGSSTEVEFQHGYDLIRPFDDEFVVFPWSLMDAAAMNAADSPDDAVDVCRSVFEDVRDHRSVLVLNWHAGDVFDDGDYPGWGAVYERIVAEAIEMSAWVGPPGTFYGALQHPDGTVEQALEALAEEHPRVGGQTPDSQRWS